jgi:DNA-binding transcriptional MerR regulator
MPVLTIGKLAALAGVRADTLRYYERERLLAPAAKSDSGYRLYDGDSVRRVRFIKQAQRCGFTLAEIGELLAFRHRASARCGDVRKLAEDKKRQLEARIRSMKTMSKALERLIADCAVPSHPVDECPILSALDRADGARATRSDQRTNLSVRPGNLRRVGPR